MHWMEISLLVFNTIVTALFPPNFKLYFSFLWVSATVISLFLLCASLTQFISCAHCFTLPTQNRLLLFGLHCSCCWMKEKMDSVGEEASGVWPNGVSRVGSSSSPAPCPPRGTVPWYMNRTNILEELEMLKDSQCFRTVSYSDDEIVLFSFFFFLFFKMKLINTPF